MKNMQWALIALTTICVFISCEKDELNEVVEVENVATQTVITEADIAEEAFPGRTGQTEKMFYGLNQIAVTKIDENYVYEGDILLAPDQLERELGDSQRSVGRIGGRWEDNIVYYEINPALPNQQRVTDAIADWEANTAVRLVPRTNQPDWVYFTPGGGCSSFVGRVGGRQPITLGNGCSTGSTIHEIGHAVGLWHEQSRADRGEYINILFENITTGFENNFQTYVQQGSDGNEFTAQLDFESIMLYPSFAFSKNGQPTITRLDGSTYGTNRTSLSSGDIEGINQMYPGETTGGDICEGVDPFVSGTTYNVGDRVTYQGSLYERATVGWTLIGVCNQVEPVDICAGVAPWSANTTYSTGDRVTYQGNLYERLTVGWSFIGACG